MVSIIDHIHHLLNEPKNKIFLIIKTGASMLLAKYPCNRTSLQVST